MKTTVETISPAKARELLERHLKSDAQRKLSDSIVEGYARAMRAGNWLLTHQGIAIDDEGELIDGQHRLNAVIRSCVPVRMMMTVGLPHNGQKSGMLTIDAIDRGAERGVGQQLQLRHGIANGNLTAAVLRGLLWLASQSEKIMPGKFQVSFALRVMDCYGAEVRHCVNNRSQDYGVRNGAVIAAAVFAMKASGAEARVRDFYHKLTTGEGLSTGDPALTARRWLMNSVDKSGTLAQYRGVLTCAMKHVRDEKLTKLYDSEHGYNFFLEMQRGTVRKVLRECGFPV